MTAADDRRLRAARLGAQGLVRPAGGSAEEVVRHLVAVQAQDARGARLAVRARSVGLTAADVDAALTSRRSLVVTWLNRGTLHLIASEDLWWLHAITSSRQVTANRRRLRQEGVGEDQAVRGVEVVTGAVRSEGPQTREQLQVVLDRAGVPTAGQALVHVLLAASIAGRIVRGPMVDGSQAFVDAEAWCGPREPVEPAEAWSRLARRYLRAHGPASAEDLARWAGLPLGAARSAFDAVADEVVPCGTERVQLADAPAHPALPPPRLLGAFDPVLHGWASRTLFTGEHTRVVTTNGVFRPTVLVDGTVVGTWILAPDAVRVRPLERIPRAATAHLEAEAADVQRFLGRTATARVVVEQPTAAGAGR